MVWKWCPYSTVISVLTVSAQMWYYFNSNVFYNIIAEVSMDVTQIKLVIFDVGQTLLFLTPTSWINRQLDVVDFPNDYCYLFRSRQHLLCPSGRRLGHQRRSIAA